MLNAYLFYQSSTIAFHIRRSHSDLIITALEIVLRLITYV